MVRVYDPRTGRLDETLEGHTKKVESVAYSADGSLLATGSDDRTIRIWHAGPYTAPSSPAVPSSSAVPSASAGSGPVIGATP